LKWFKCGKKGYGLKALERVAKGHFIIEYVGEVMGTILFFLLIISIPM
jgi:histone-lysine N-methyltransferase SETD2